MPQTIGDPSEVNRENYVRNAFDKMPRPATLDRAARDNWVQSGKGHWGTCNLANLGTRRALNGLLARDRQIGSKNVGHPGESWGVLGGDWLPEPGIWIAQRTAAGSQRRWHHAALPVVVQSLKEAGDTPVMLDFLVAEAVSVICRRTQQRKTNPPDLRAIVTDVKAIFEQGRIEFSARSVSGLRRLGLTNTRPRTDRVETAILREP